MGTFFAIWLALTVVMNIYICWRWTEKGLLNFSIKLGYFFISVGGIVLAYHHFVAGQPL